MDPSTQTIAIVEDDTSVQVALAALLRALGFQTASYGSAEAFLAGSLAEEFDCILMDQNLPGMSGLALSAYLGARGIRTPHVLITGRDESLVRQECAKSEIPLIIKPPTAESLKLAISAAIAGENGLDRGDESICSGQSC